MKVLVFLRREFTLEHISRRGGQRIIKLIAKASKCPVPLEVGLHSSEKQFLKTVHKERTLLHFAVIDRQGRAQSVSVSRRFRICSRLAGVEKALFRSTSVVQFKIAYLVRESIL